MKDIEERWIANKLLMYWYFQTCKQDICTSVTFNTQIDFARFLLSRLYIKILHKNLRRTILHFIFRIYSAQWKREFAEINAMYELTLISNFKQCSGEMLVARAWNLKRTLFGCCSKRDFKKIHINIGKKG